MFPQNSQLIIGFMKNHFYLLWVFNQTAFSLNFSPTNNLKFELLKKHLKHVYIKSINETHRPNNHLVWLPNEYVPEIYA